MASEHDDSLEELLGADDADAKPQPEETPAKAEPAEAAKPEEPAKEERKPEKPAGKPKPAPAPAPPKRRGPWPTVVVIILVLLAAAVGLGWYASELRGQVGALKGELETLKTQATGMETTAGNVADDLLPLIEEHATIAKLRATAGDAEGAKYSLTLAKRYADMADRLSAGSPSSKLRGLKALIEEAEKAVGGGAVAAPAAEPATTAPEPATTGEQPAATASPEPGVQSPQPAAPTVAPEAAAKEAQPVPPSG